MRLKKYCLSLITVWSLLLKFSLASVVTTTRNIVSKSEDGVGCTGTLTSSSVGFNALVLSYGNAAALGFKFYDDSWVADSYTAQETLFTANSITSPNFSITNNLLASETLYGNEVEISSIIVQLTGFFRGMFFFFFFFHISFSNTNIFFIN